MIEDIQAKRIINQNKISFIFPRARSTRLMTRTTARKIEIITILLL